MKGRLLHIALWLLALPLGLHAQQDPMHSMYMFNGLALNPAYAGSREALSGTFIGRRQWMGLNGSPTSAAFSLHAPSASMRSGFGVVLAGDRAGFTDNVTLLPSYALRIPAGENAYFCLGIQFGLNTYRARLSEVSTWQANDPSFNGQDFTRLHLLAGSGFYYHTRRVYVGFSVPNFLPTRLYPKDFVDGQARKVRHYFATGGLVLDVGSSVKFKPSVLLKYAEGGPVAVDFNAAFLLDETIWLGGSFRPENGWALMAELNVKKFLRIGYAYDLMRNRLSPYAGGTHEIMLGFDLGFEKSNMESPRFF